VIGWCRRVLPLLDRRKGRGSRVAFARRSEDRDREILEAFDGLMESARAIKRNGK